MIWIIYFGIAICLLLDDNDLIVDSENKFIESVSKIVVPFLWLPLLIFYLFYSVSKEILSVKDSYVPKKKRQSVQDDIVYFNAVLDSINHQPI